MTSFLLNDDLTADHHLAIAFVAEESGGCEFHCDSYAYGDGHRASLSPRRHEMIQLGVEKDPLGPQAIEIGWP